MTFLNGVRVFFLGLWLGAALFFSAVVAPSVFSVLRSFHLSNANEIAGTIVTRTLSVVNVWGFVIGLLSLGIAVAFRSAARRGLFTVEVVSLALLAITTAVGQWVIAARMLAIRTALVIPIDQIAADDPRRVAFNSLHHYSVSALSVAMLAGIVGMIVVTFRINGEKYQRWK
jgi:hypothetical protein